MEIQALVMKNDEDLYHQVSSFTPGPMRLRTLLQSKRTTARYPVQHIEELIRAIGLSIRNIN